MVQKDTVIYVETVNAKPVKTFVIVVEHRQNIIVRLAGARKEYIVGAIKQWIQSKESLTNSAKGRYMENYEKIRQLSYSHGHVGKRVYMTIELARQAAKSVRKSKGPKVKPYKCRFGKHYHIGHSRSGKKIDILRKRSGIIKSDEKAISRPEETRKDSQEGKTL